MESIDQLVVYFFILKKQYKFYASQDLYTFYPLFMLQ